MMLLDALLLATWSLGVALISICGARLIEMRQRQNLEINDDRLPLEKLIDGETYRQSVMRRLTGRRS